MKNTIYKSIIISVLLLNVLVASPVFASVNQSAMLDAVDEKIAAAVGPLQQQILDLKNENFRLSQRVAQLESAKAIVQPVVDLTPLSNRVSVLEGGMGTLKKQVASILKKLGIK